MEEKQMANLVQLIEELATNTSGTWQERKQAFLKMVEKQGAKNGVEEFLGWFGVNWDEECNI